MSNTDEQRENRPEEQAQVEGGAPAGNGETREADSLRAELEKLQAELESKDRRIDEVTRAYSGLLNDQKDFRARLEREKERVLENERGNVALVLLEAADELDRALAASEEQGGPLAEGVRLVREGLMQRLQRMGIERLELVGKPFDPNLAEAIDLEVTSDPAMAEVVVAEALPGYRLGNRLLRAAKVKVARYLPPAAPPDGSTETPSA